MQDRPDEITVLLRRHRQGDEGAADELLRVVYEELRRISCAYMGREVAGHTLQTTALELSPRTVDREWALASAWMRGELSRKGAA